MTLEQFRAEVAAQPDALERLAGEHAGNERFDRLRDAARRTRRVLLVGAGSSRFATSDAALALRAAGIDAHSQAATTLRPQPADTETLCVLVSASGRTPEVLATFERHRSTGVTVAITAADDSPLHAADIVLQIPGGPEASGVVSRSLQATIAFLQLLSAAVLGEAPAPIIAAWESAATATRHLLETGPRWVVPLADRMQGRPVWLAAPDGRMTPALQGALLIRELVRVFADATEVGDWSHSDVYLTRDPAYQLLLFGGREGADELLDWMRLRHRTLVTVGRPVTPAADVHIGHPGADDPRVAALVETTVPQLLAAELAARGAAGLLMLS